MHVDHVAGLVVAVAQVLLQRVVQAHMIYLHVPALKAMKADLAKFYDASNPR